MTTHHPTRASTRQIVRHLSGGQVERTLEPEFISIPEWARRLGISAESGYKAARLGQIPGCFNIGRLYRVNWPVFMKAASRMRSGAGDAG